MTTPVKSPRLGRPSTGKGPVYDKRISLGLSQPEMAERLGVSLRTVKNLERLGTKPQSAASKRILESM